MWVRVKDISYVLVPPPIKIGASITKSASLEKVLHLGKAQERTFRYADWLTSPRRRTL